MELSDCVLNCQIAFLEAQLLHVFFEAQLLHPGKTWLSRKARFVIASSCQMAVWAPFWRCIRLFSSRLIGLFCPSAMRKTKFLKFAKDGASLAHFEDFVFLIAEG